MVRHMIYDLDIIKNCFDLPWEIKDHLEHAEYPFVFFVDGNMAVYGDAEEYNSIFHIRNVCSVEKRKGLGSSFINYLFSEKNIREVRGESTPEAAPFWSRMGAKFVDSTFQEFIEDDEFQGLIPFCVVR